jgi:hypothetical protein
LRSFGTTFFTQLGTISNPFLITVITDLVDTLFTPISFYTMEKVGRRPLLIWGGLGMCVCEVIVALIGTIAPDNQNAVRAMIAFICICKSLQLLLTSHISWPALNIARYQTLPSLPDRGVPVLGSSSARFSLFPSDLEVSVCPPLPTGCGIVSSPSSR